jgi:hypothetical protein
MTDFVPGVCAQRPKRGDDEVLRDYGRAEMERTLDVLTEALLEVYFEQNPRLGEAVGRA